MPFGTKIGALLFFGLAPEDVTPSIPSSLRWDVDSRIQENGTSHVWVALSGGFDGMCLSWLRGFNSVVGDAPSLFYFTVLFIFLFLFRSFIFIALFL